MPHALLLNTGAKSAGATQTFLDLLRTGISDRWSVSQLCLGSMNVGFCRGCKTCYETNTCVVSDDMALLVQEMAQADVLVLAVPSYWADVPAQLMAFIDRCTPYANTNPNPAHFALPEGKVCHGIALRTGTHTPECQHLLDTLNHWCGHMGVTFGDSLLFCGIETAKDVLPHAETLRQKAREWFPEA